MYFTLVANESQTPANLDGPVLEIRAKQVASDKPAYTPKA